MKDPATIYTRLPLTEAEFQLFHGLAIATRKEVFDKWAAATDPKEKAFYSSRVDEYDRLIASKFTSVLVADKSQDDA